MRTLMSLVLLVVIAVPAFAQSNYAILTGIVTDEQHLPVASATIQVTATGTGAVRRVTSGPEGRFEFAALLPDEYELKIDANGFTPELQTLRLEVGQKLAITITTHVGLLKQGVQVVAGSEVLRTTDASVGEVIEPKSIRELPLNGRMLIDLVLTVPGAHVGFGV
jgi:hypothetical protein